MVDVASLYNNASGSKTLPMTSIEPKSNSLTKQMKTRTDEFVSRNTINIDDQFNRQTITTSESNSYNKNIIKEQNEEKEKNIIDIITNPLSDIYSKNILNSYNNMSYIISMFAVPQQAYFNYSEHKKMVRDEGVSNLKRLSIEDFLQEEEKIIIAETAETASYQINELEFGTNPGVDRRTGFTPLTTVTMTITEASGASLIDRLIGLANSLGWRSNQDMPFFIDIEFIGEDDNGMMRQIDEHGSYRWEVIVNSMAPALGFDCTKYSVILVPIDDMGSDVNHFQVMETVQIRKSEAKTLGQAITVVEKKINDQNFIYMNPEWVKYFVDKNQYNFKYLKTEDNELEIENFKNRVIDWNDELESTGIIIPASASMQSVIQKLFSSTISTDSNNTKKEISLPRIETRVYYKGIDSDTKDKIYGVDFIINVEYKEISAVLYSENTDWLNDMELYKQKQKEIFDIVYKNHMLKKNYFFTFSEQNESVIDADFNSTFNWSIGITAPNLKVTEGKITKINAEKNKTESEEKEREYTEYLKTYKDLKTGQDNLIAEGKDITASSIVIEQTRQKMYEIKKEMYGRADTKLESINPPESIRSSKSQTNYKRTFLNDVVMINGNAKWENRVHTVKSIDKYATATSQGGFKETTQDTSYIKSNEYKCVQERGGFLDVNLTIKGDPYWFGESNKQIVIPASKKNGSTYWDWHANYGQGGMCFFFSTKTPGKRDEIGNFDYKESFTINSVYIITSVTHTFNEGKFTQAISGTWNDLFNFLGQ